MSTTKDAILATLVYAHLFDFPLTPEEIWEGLIVKAKIKSQKKEVERALESLIRKKKCFFQEGLIFLPGRKKLVGIRKKRKAFSKAKIKKAKGVIEFLHFLPWIKLIGLTGTLSRQNAKEDDDIDLFFITAQNRLWLTRGLVVLFLFLTGNYRRPERIKDMICPNMLVTEDSLEMIPHDLYTAYEVYLMKPIFVREKTDEKFWAANDWVEEFLPNGLKGKRGNLKSQIKKGENKNPFFSLSFIGLMEKLAMNLQLKFMSRKKTTEVTTTSMIKFHPQDIREKVLQKYQKNLQHTLS